MDRASIILSLDEISKLMSGEEVVSKRIAHTGFIVLQRMHHHDGRQFIAPSFWDTKEQAELYASALDNVVAIMPIEWEE